MSKHGEPLRRVEATIMRNDGKVVVQGTSHRDSRCTKCQCSASTFVHVESAERMIACTNACANIPHPEMLPELVEAVRKVDGRFNRSEEIDREADLEAIYAMLRAFHAVMGEKP